MMHRPATSIAIILAVLSGFVLAQIWSLGPVTSRSIQALPSEQVETTTLAFYRAVNDYLDGGDGDSLRWMLHPDFITHQPGGAATGNAEGFLQQLNSIRRFYPGLQLTTDVTPISDSAASVTLAWNDVERAELAGIAIDPVDVLGRLDLVRIERGRIIERWSSAQVAERLDAYSALSIDLPVSMDTLVARVRQISLEGDYELTTNLFRHVLLVNLSSEAFLEVTLPASVPVAIWKQNRERVAAPAPVEPETIVALNQMEAVFIPAGTRFRMWDAGDQNASLVALEFGPPVSSEIRPGAPLFAELRTTLWSGIELKGVGNHLTLSFGQARLLPGSALSSRDVRGMELTWIASGALDMAATSGEARVRATSGLRSQLIEGHAELRSGDAGAAGPGTDVTYRVVGGDPATAWLFSLVAAPDQADADELDTPTAPAPLPTPQPRRNLS